LSPLSPPNPPGKTETETERGREVERGREIELKERHEGKDSGGALSSLEMEE
jgi:hypothetical protein